MTVIQELAPPMSPHVSVSPPDRSGESVAKNHEKRSYVRLGEQERFLLLKLDGKSSCETIAADFRERYGEAISAADVQDFVSMAQKEGLVERPSKSGKRGATQPSQAKTAWLLDFIKRCVAQARKQSPLFFRVAVFDPDVFLNWLEPRTRWLFSLELGLLATVLGGWALVTTWLQRAALAGQFQSQFGWQAICLAFFVAIVVSILHEFGHGLACKRFGGEVHEMGALWIFFTPCLYCNVSDAWLLPSRWQRLLISAAGTYVDFIVWILSVAIWRVTDENTTVNFMAWVVVSTCGLRVFFNVNPLLRLDGYYALSDLLGQHNLRRRARQRWMEYVRWLLWGAARPQPVKDGTTLFLYGVVSWWFKVGFLLLLGFKFSGWLRSMIGLPGIFAGAAFVAVISKRYFRGSLGEDFKIMFRLRRTRILVFATIVIGAMFVPIHDRVGGEFQVKPLVHWEVRAPVAGFLNEMQVHEGDDVDPGCVVAQLEIPELTSNIARKKLEITEAEANLRRLEAGPRQEEMHEQRERVQRAAAWRDLANTDLDQARKSFQAELTTLDIRIAQAKSDVEYRATLHDQARQLYDKGGLAGRQLLTIKKQLGEAQSALDEALAHKRVREADGVLQYEAELAKREKELADTKSTLTLLEAGSRLEDIEAETARLVRLREELRHFEQQQQNGTLTCPVHGTVITPRLADKLGQYFERGAVICIIEDLGKLEAEIAVAEQDAKTLSPGQGVILKPRSLPLVKFTGRVDRVSPAVLMTNAATASASRAKTVTVYCQFENPQGLLRGGMTGFGKVDFGMRSLGSFLFRRGLRTLRSEFLF